MNLIFSADRHIFEPSIRFVVDVSNSAVPIFLFLTISIAGKTYICSSPLESSNIPSIFAFTDMGRYAAEPDNATKAAKAKGSNLRVHFKVIFLLFVHLPIFTLSLTDIFHVFDKKAKKKGIVVRSLKAA